MKIKLEENLGPIIPSRIAISYYPEFAQSIRERINEISSKKFYDHSSEDINKQARDYLKSLSLAKSTRDYILERFLNQFDMEKELENHNPLPFNLQHFNPKGILGDTKSPLLEPLFNFGDELFSFDSYIHIIEQLSDFP